MKVNYREYFVQIDKLNFNGFQGNSNVFTEHAFLYSYIEGEELMGKRLNH